MPDLKISQLPAASTPLAGTELVPIVQGGTTDQTTVQAILTSAVPSGTANGVLYLNGSKVVTSGSGLTFDGTTLKVGSVAGATVVFPRFSDNLAVLWVRSNSAVNEIEIRNSSGGGENYLKAGNGYLAFGAETTEQMRLTSTGLGIGTSSPAARLHSVVADGSYPLAVSGTTKGVRFETNATETRIVGVDNTLTASFQPLSLGGSQVIVRTNGSTQAAVFDSSGNLGLGVTPSVWHSSYRVFQFADLGALWQTSSFVGLSNNSFADASNVNRYLNSNFASFYAQVSGQHRWHTAPSGTAGNAISFTQALTLDVNRNLALNTTSVGTNAVGALSIGSGTEPSSGPADTVQLYSVDRSAGNTIPAFYCEGTGVTDAGITNTTVTHKIAMKINGTVYYLLATTNAT